MTTLLPSTNSSGISDSDLALLSPSFRWGAATAAYQVEGASAADGKGPSIWDTFSHESGRTKNGDNGDIAAQHYYRYEDDFAAAAKLGMNAQRLSLSWPRILPNGTGAVNQAGLDHYEKVIDSLLEQDMEPLVTLFHWDLPQALEDRGGWYNRDSAKWFGEYAQVVLDRLGDRVPKWLTLNEPWTVIGQGYCRGIHAPGHADYHRAGTAIHHLLLAHGYGLEAFRAADLDAEMGITLSMAVPRPWSDAPRDVAAARLLDGEQNRVYLDPLFNKGYPQDLYRLFPTLFDNEVVQEGDLEAIGAPMDFLGVNYYLNHFVKYDPTVPILNARQINPVGPMMTAGIAAVPEALEDCLVRVHTEYTDLPIYVTEMGASTDDYVDPEGRVKDSERIDYLEKVVQAIINAKKRDVDVRGLYVWSLLDNLEWELGYSIRFGLFYVNYGTQERVLKDSSFWYQDLIYRHRALDTLSGKNRADR